MTPFRVRCETCHTALRVRDEGFIGEVHACPKCGSMVQILAPAAEEPSAPTTDSRGVTTAVLGSTLEVGPEDLIETAESGPAAVSSGPIAGPTDGPATGPAAKSAVEPVAPRPAKAGWPVLLGGGVALFAMGIGIAAWLAGPGDTPEKNPEPDEAANVEPAVEIREREPNLPAVTADTETTPAAAEEIEPELIDSAPVLPDIDDSTRDATLATDQPEPLQIDEASIDGPADGPAGGPIAQQPAPATGPAASDLVIAAPPSFDPLDYDPATIELVLTRGEAPSSSEPKRNQQIRETPAQPAPETALDEQLAAVGRREAVTVERGPSADAKNRPPSIPADTLLAVVVPRIDLQGMPLAEAIDFFTGLSGAPVTISPQTLARAGLGPSTEVSFQAENQPLAAVLADGLAPRRLAIETRGPHVVVTRTGAAEVRATTHRLGDLAEPSPALLHDLLRSVGPPATRRAELSPGGTLQLKARRGEHFDLLIFAERLRAARGLPLQTKYPRQLAERPPALAGLGPTLARRTTFSFVEPTPLREVIDHIQRVTRWTVLVDWVSLADGAGLGPHSTLTASTTNRPWIEALDGLLGPLGLAWAPIDERTIWIASQAQINAEPPTDFYRTSERLARAAIEKLAARRPNAGARYDNASRRLIVRGGSDAHLAAWRAIGEVSQ